MSIIDSHFHWWPRSFFERLCARKDYPRAQRNAKGGYRYWRRHGENPLFDVGAEWFELDEQLAHMYVLGREVAVVSSIGPLSRHFSELPEQEGRDAAMLWNEEMACMQRRHPGRFWGTAAIPLLRTQTALQVLDSAIKGLGLRGANLPGGIVEDPQIEALRLEPLYARAARLGVPLFIHPTDAEFADLLLFPAILERYPKLEIVVSLTRGLLPSQTARLDKRLYVDAVSRHAIEHFGLDHVIYGSDYPCWDPDTAFRSCNEVDLTAQDRNKVLRENVINLMGLSEGTKMHDTRSKLSRRDLARILTAGAVSIAALSPRGTHAQAPSSPEPGMKFGLRWSSNPSDQDLLFLKQIGATHVTVTIPIPPATDITQVRLPTVEQLLAIKARYESAGLRIHKFMGPLMIPPKEVVLNLPGRDHAIELYKQWIQTNSEAGFYCVGASYMLTGVWQSGKVATRFAPTREFDASAASFQNGYKRDEPAFGREYSRDEIIANFNYFIRQIAPVAERAKVAIAFHPDDVPVYDKLAGVPRIFNTFSEIKERLAAARSPNVGMILCCGVWIEGGAGMGCSVEDAIRYFVSNHRVWEIHFRNVSSTLPKFNEAFMDNGVYDMYKIMKTVYDSGYRELIHYDHTPDMVGAPYAYPAYAFGYMHACYQRAVAGSPVTGAA